MELILIKSYKHLSLYEKEWSVILEANNNTNSFIEYEFLYNWWSQISEDNKIEIYAVKEHNRIIAFFPFHLNKRWFGYKVHFLSAGDSINIGIIAKNRDMNRVIMFVLDNFIQQKKSAVFYLHGFVEGSNAPVKLSNYLKARNMKERYYQIVNSNIYPQKLSNNGFEDYTRKTIFSTNTIKAKAYRNFLWATETIISKEYKWMKN